MSGNEKKSLVPQLRFPEFQEDGEWFTPTLGDVSEPVNERVGDRKLIPISISAGIGFVTQSEKFGRDISGNQYKLYTVVRDGDFVYNKGNSLKFPQGCVYDLQGWGEVAAPNVFICFRLRDGYDNGFYRQCFEKNAHGNQLRKHITSGARSNGLLNISKDAFYGVKIPTPKIAEQKKIADCLSSLDNLITAEVQKLDSLKKYKQGLMQQLFPRVGESIPRLRFPDFREAGEWKEVKLSTQIDLISGLHLAPEQYSDAGDIPYFTGPSDYTNYLSEVSKWTVRSANTGNAGDILITVKGSGVGELLYLKLDTIAMGRQLMAVRPHGSHGGFIFHLLTAQRQQFVVLASGNLIPGLSRNDILGLTISIPELSEQQAIAEFLSSSDDLITAQSHRVDALRTQKKSLLQQLFPVLDEVPA